jgi:hypothetical protein
MIAVVRLTPLSLRVLVLSWALAMAAWPLAWALLAVAQGIGVLLAGGGWIGVALPLGLHPWGLANEPTIAFASSRAALYLYWLAPSLAALLLAVALPAFVPSPRGWLGEMALFQLGVACATLGLGWAPALGEADGPAAALAKFWHVRPEVFVIVTALAGAAAVQLGVVRLTSHLWSLPGGPMRGRRLLTVLAHAMLPALAWIAAVIVSGWAPRPHAVLAAAAVLVSVLAGAWLWVPHAPLRPRREVRWRTVALVALLGGGISLAALWAGTPGRGRGEALLWGQEGVTSNVRPLMDVVSLRPHHDPRTPQAP